MQKIKITLFSCKSVKQETETSQSSMDSSDNNIEDSPLVTVNNNAKYETSRIHADIMKACHHMNDEMESCQIIQSPSTQTINSPYVQASLVLAEDPKYAPIIKETAMNFLNTHRSLFFDRGDDIIEILNDIKFSKRNHACEVKVLATLFLIPIMMIKKKCHSSYLPNNIQYTSRHGTVRDDSGNSNDTRTRISMD